MNKESIERLLRERLQFRLNKQFVEADKIRQDLKDKGILLSDTRDGTRYRDGNWKLSGFIKQPKGV
jgi:cysteinyl-tRNA synthetase